MIRIFDDIDKERDRIRACINKYGWTSDHNLDWFIDAGSSENSRPVFAEFPDGSGLLAHDNKIEWSIWSDPLSSLESAEDKIIEFSDFAFKNGIREVWCVDVSDNIRPSLLEKKINVSEIYYSLLWPVLDMEKFDLSLPGDRFKEMRNARNKFYREHKVKSVSPKEIEQELLHKIVNEWKNYVLKKQKEEDISDIKYHKAIGNYFKSFLDPRVFVVDGKPVGFNAGYEVVNRRGRFGGIIGIHDYSLNDLGTVLWLEDLEWIKNRGYQELDMQGSEDDEGLKLKLRFGAKIERKTDTFWLTK